MYMYFTVCTVRVFLDYTDNWSLWILCTSTFKLHVATGTEVQDAYFTRYAELRKVSIITVIVTYLIADLVTYHNI